MEKNNRGFTLVELLAVIVIMGILMMVAIPSISRTIENSRKDTFVDIAKSYVNSARTLWTADGLTCEGEVSSGVDDGDYYILINTKESARSSLPVLLDQGGKSSWGNRDVNGYVRVHVETVTDGAGEAKRTTTFYVGLSDGTHGVLDTGIAADALKRGNVNMNLSAEDKKKVELTVDDGRLNCFKNASGLYTCADVMPVKSITGVCVDDQTSVGTVSPPVINAVSFKDDDWSTIAAAVKSGNYPYQVGETKTVDMGTTFGTHTLRVANTTPCDGTLESETACGFVLEFADIISNQELNFSSKLVGGWPASSMRTYVNNDIYNALPAELRSVIIDTKVVSGHGSSDSSNFTSTDRLYLLSTAEVWEQGTSSTISGDTARESTRQLDYYANKRVTTSDNYSVAIKQYNGTNTIWWLRAAYSPAVTYFFIVNKHGSSSYADNVSARGVSPAFRIG